MGGGRYPDPDPDPGIVGELTRHGGRGGGRIQIQIQIQVLLGNSQDVGGGRIQIQIQIQVLLENVNTAAVGELLLTPPCPPPLRCSGYDDLQCYCRHGTPLLTPHAPHTARPLLPLLPPWHALAELSLPPPPHPHTRRLLS